MATLAPIDDFQGFGPARQQTSQNDINQSDFLTLMITQFQNQDPFEPMDNGEFLGQLAQFSTVSGIGELNTSFSGLSTSMLDNQALQAAGMVGRTVMAVTDAGYLGESGSVNGAIELLTSAGNVQLDIEDEAGALVKTINLGEQEAGIVDFAWDGTDSSGERVDTGLYTLSARVVRGNEVENAATVIEAEIESITLGQFGEGLTLNLPGGQEMPMSQVYQIIG